MSYYSNFLFPPGILIRKLCFEEGGVECLSFYVIESFIMFFWIFCWKLFEVVLVFYGRVDFYIFFMF